MPDRSSHPLTVVIPTIGRVDQLRACLESIAASRSLPREVVIVDQSRADAVGALVTSFEALAPRVIPCGERGIGLGVNLGIRESENEVVLVTHDDCTVADSWVDTAWRLMSEDGNRLVTGRVIPGGDPLAVPTAKDHPRRQDFTGHAYWGGLLPMNMAFRRSDVLRFGGFDERFTVAGEDNDFCYRWLLSGHRLHYMPELVVWHHDARTPQQLERVYVSYWRGQGRFYAKHLWRGDARMLRYIARDVLWDAPRAVRDRLKHGRPRWTDSRRGILAGLPRGLVEGAWQFRNERRARQAAEPRPASR